MRVGVSIPVGWTLCRSTTTSIIKSSSGNEWWRIRGNRQNIERIPWCIVFVCIKLWKHFWDDFLQTEISQRDMKNIIIKQGFVLIIGSLCVTPECFPFPSHRDISQTFGWITLRLITTQSKSKQRLPVKTLEFWCPCTLFSHDALTTHVWPHDTML